MRVVVLGATWNGDATRVMSWGGDGIVRLMDVREDITLAELPHDMTVYGAAFSADETPSLNMGGRMVLSDAGKLILMNYLPWRSIFDYSTG